VLYDLARLIEADIAPIAAVERLLGDPHEDKDRAALQALAADLKRGCSLARALGSAGAAGRLECAVVDVGAQAGKLALALRFVADRFETRVRRAASLRVRLWLPNFVLFVALAVGVVRAVTAGAAPAAALFKAVLVGLAVIVLTRILLAALKLDANVWLTFGWRLGLHRRSALFREYFEQVFYTLVAWQAAAGIDPVTAAKALRGLLDAPDYVRAVDRYRRSVTDGRAFSRALEDAGLLVPGELRQVIVSGEASGRLAGSLEHYLGLQQARLERVTDTVFTWLPRFYYLCVLLLGASTLV